MTADMVPKSPKIPTQLSQNVRKCFDDEVSNIRVALSNSTSQSNPITGEYLATAIEHMTTTRSFFMDDARQFITLVLVLFLASGLVGANSFAEGKDPRDATILRIVALCIVVIILPVTRALESKARAAYEFYVSSAMHAAIVHSAVSLGGCHEWFAHVDRCIQNVDEKDTKEIEDFDYRLHWKQVIIKCWMRSSSKGFRGANLLQSFNDLLLLCRIVAVVAFVFGLVVMYMHAPSESVNSSPSHQTQSSATIQAQAPVTIQIQAPPKK